MNKIKQLFHKWLESTFGQRTVVALATVTTYAGQGYAQSAGGNPGAGVQAFQNATNAIAQYQDPIQKLLYAIAIVIALVGAFNIFNKMNNGDQDVKKTIMLTLGGCIALVVLANALPLFFK